MHFLMEKNSDDDDLHHAPGTPHNSSPACQTVRILEKKEPMRASRVESGQYEDCKVFRHDDPQFTLFDHIIMSHELL